MEEMVSRKMVMHAAFCGNCDSFDVNTGKCGLKGSRCADKDVIEKVPSYDSVRVIRCKDCRFRNFQNFCFKLNKCTADNFFCAYPIVGETE